MNLYVDLRSLPDAEGPAPADVRLLHLARRYLPGLERVVGLRDAHRPTPPSLDESVDSWQAELAPNCDRRAVFFQLSCQDRASELLMSWIGRANVFPCALFPEQSWHDLQGSVRGARRRALAWLVWVRHFRALGVPSPEVARELRAYLPNDSAVVVGESRSGEERRAERFWTHVRRRLAAWAGAENGIGPWLSGNRRPRLALLTPYPPDRSGMADYTAWAVRSLARHADVDIFTDTPAPRRDPWVRSFEPISFRPYLTAAYDRVIALIGNSRFHLPILDLHRRYGGPCLLHDLNLAELYALLRGPAGLAALASRSARAVSVEEVKGWLLEQNQFPGLLLDELLPCSRPLLVSSRTALESIRRQYPAEGEVVPQHPTESGAREKGTARAVLHVPFLCPPRFTGEELSPEARAEARRRLGLPDDRVVIITPGVVHYAKGPLECIWALEHLRSWGLAADLHFVGASLFLKSILLPWLPRLRLEGHVVFHDDWLAPETYHDYLRAADLAVVLRSRRPGALSEAVLDCIAAGLPTVVNEDLARTLEGETVLLSVPDRFSPLLIAEALWQAYHEGWHRRRLTPQRADYLHEHSPSRYATQLLRALEVA